MSVATVEIGDNAKADLLALQEENPELVREALRQLLALEQDPYAGEPLREKSNRKPLAQADCRKLKFDRPDRSPRADPRYRFRIVDRIEPHEGSPHRVYVIAVSLKREAYGAGTARAAKRLRELARESVRERRQSRRRDKD